MGCVPSGTIRALCCCMLVVLSMTACRVIALFCTTACVASPCCCGVASSSSICPHAPVTPCCCARWRVCHSHMTKDGRHCATKCCNAMWAPHPHHHCHACLPTVCAFHRDLQQGSYGVLCACVKSCGPRFVWQDMCADVVWSTCLTLNGCC